MYCWESEKTRVILRYSRQIINIESITTWHLQVMKRSEMMSALMKKNRASVQNQYASIAKARIRNTSEIVVIAWVAVNHCKSTAYTIMFSWKSLIQCNTIFFFLEFTPIGQSNTNCMKRFYACFFSFTKEQISFFKICYLPKLSSPTRFLQVSSTAPSHDWKYQKQNIKQGETQGT